MVQTNAPVGTAAKRSARACTRGSRVLPSSPRSPTPQMPCASAQVSAAAWSTVSSRERSGARWTGGGTAGSYPLPRLDPLEHVFDHGRVSAAPDLAPDVLAQLRARIGALEGAPARTPVPTYAPFTPLVQLRSGGTYVVDAASLALGLIAGASAGGEWVGVLGWPDLGAEAAA